MYGTEYEQGEICERGYAFFSRAWKEMEFHCVKLEEVCRQKDAEFLGILNDIKYGRNLQNVIAYLESNQSSDLMEEAPYLVGTNAKADAIKVLERIHHVFNEIENVVVIVAMEKKQISNSLHQIYGDEMDVDRYLKKIIAFSFKLDNGSAHNFIEKYASYMEMFDIKERDGLEEFLKEITANIDIRTQEKIFEKAENLHRLLATQEKMDSGILAFEILTLCIKEKLSVVDLRWIIDMSGYSNVENKIGKEYFNTIRERVKYIIKYSSTVNGKIVCKADSFVDRMIFIIAGLDNVYKNKVCAEFF